MLISRLARLREDWPDAARMVISTVLAATVATVLHLPEMYWAVLSAVIVSRPGAGGSAKAGAARLIGTVFGSAVAMGVIVARAWHVPEIALLAAAMIPLSLLITAFEEYRTAPVAAVILLSSGSALISPLHLALLRLAQITIGSLASTVVGISVLPSRGHGRVFRMGAAIVTRIGAVLEGAFDEHRDDARLDTAHDEIRRDLRDLGALVRTKSGGASRAQGRMVRLLSRLQADSMFVARIVGSGMRRASASEYARAIHGVCRDLADGMLDPESSAIQQCREALEGAAAAFAQARQRAVGDARAGGGEGGSGASAGSDAAAGPVEPPAVDTAAGPVDPPAIDALDFLLETLAKDLRDLIRVLQGPRLLQE